MLALCSGFAPTLRQSQGDQLPKTMSKTSATDTADLVSEAAIRDRAYHLWEAAGRPEGNADHFWHEAHRQMTTELIARSSDGTAKARGGKVVDADEPKAARAPRLTKIKKVTEEATKPAKKATKKATKPRAAGVPITH